MCIRFIGFVGDSFVQGIGYAEHRGWVGRVPEAIGGNISGFNVGWVRRDTSEDVLRRCWREVLPRTLPGSGNRLVVSFGSNDAIQAGGAVRVDGARALRNLAAIPDECRRQIVSPPVVGPPPVIDAGEEHLRRTAERADGMAALCQARDIPFVTTTLALASDPVWIKEARDGDGSPTGFGGYRRLAEFVLAGQWREWITQLNS